MKNQKKRLQWEKEHQEFDWNKVVFSDEPILCVSKFQIKWIRKYDGEELENDDYAEFHSKWKEGLRLMVWATISYEGP